MTHLTETGVHAGRPICGCDYRTRHAAGDTFNHYGYGPKPEAIADLCPDCKEELDAAFAEEDDSADLLPFTF